jgi:AcrR family transcriptional regulator
MSTTTRRERERASVRERLLSVALELLERDGPAALTIRRIAADVDYAPPIVYQHFANKDALLLALIEVGYARLVDHLRAGAGSGSGEQRVLAGTRAYVQFAATSPHLFTLMNATTVDSHERYRAAAGASEFVVETLIGWATENGITLADPQEACEIAWGTLLGMAHLGLLGTVGPDRAADLAEQAMRALLAGWRTAGR